MSVLKTLFTLTAIVSIIFIGFGDQFLPKPLNTYSRNSRDAINQRLLGLFDGETKPKEGSIIDKVHKNSNPDAYFDKSLKEAERKSGQSPQP